MRNLARSLSLSIPLTLIFFDNVAYVAKVEGVSMQPTLNDDQLVELSQNALKRYFYAFNSSDLVLLSHWSIRNYNIKRGDIVSLVSPKNPNQIIIKRIIALEGIIGLNIFSLQYKVFFCRRCCHNKRRL